MNGKLSYAHIICLPVFLLIIALNYAFANEFFLNMILISGFLCLSTMDGMVMWPGED